MVIRLSNQRDATFDVMLKTIMLGDSNVGKTCILLRFAEDGFNPGHIATIGVDFKNKIVNVHNSKVKLQIWDSAGQERFRTLTYSYYRNSQGFILTYDITNRQSYLNISSWLNGIREHCPKHVTIVLVGNKMDCDASQREVSYEEAEAFALSQEIRFFETSALTGFGVEDVFFFLAGKAASTANVTGSAYQSPLYAGSLSTDSFSENHRPACCYMM
ncbi:small GTPase family Rab subfamily protein [Gregarina niphandrodes]|uniref:Small GTPase family Rab subfamily protein n=1 Tax=Gregarina niphandrodes TaxID=110365 RepID=A0A023BBV1_GRENI|nr:small GTPase family Rab subfamily protein [Gregarina niphandrodes]EZG81121.1 small GTPase family Rab subfamily protein [Gregarina niphandrodes]|eukprot:XP_011134268.1 small GTPase family Rab subfamily protein [Gregarina niphandrodes]